MAVDARDWLDSLGAAWHAERAAARAKSAMERSGRVLSERVALGIALSNLRIVDSDEGGMDGDAGAERAMGPMQFISETWRLYGVDANNDGIVSPDNIDDAALSAAGYLCWRGKDLSTPRGWITALRAYNNSSVYTRAVRDWATAYAAGHPL